MEYNYKTKLAADQAGTLRHSAATRPQLLTKSAQLVAETNLRIQRERAEARMLAAEQRQAKLAIERARAAEAEAQLAIESARIEAELKVAAPALRIKSGGLKTPRSEDELNARRIARAERRKREYRDTIDYQLRQLRSVVHQAVAEIEAQVDALLTYNAPVAEIMVRVKLAKPFAEAEDDPAFRKCVETYAPGKLAELNELNTLERQAFRKAIERLLAQVASLNSKQQPVAANDPCLGSIQFAQPGSNVSEG